MSIKIGNEAVEYLQKASLRIKQSIQFAYIDYFINYNRNAINDVTLFIHVQKENITGYGVLYNKKWVLTIFGSDNAIFEIFASSPRHAMLVRVPLRFKKVLQKAILASKLIITEEKIYDLMKITPNRFSRMKKNDYKVKILDQSEAEELASLYFYGKYTQNHIELFKKLLTGYELTFGIKYGKKIVSACRVPIRTTKVWIISNVLTRPEYRGKGFAKSLVSGVVKKAFDLGVRVVALTVNSKNKIAKKVYRKIGFRTITKLYGVYVV
ncbi:MAG: GNAT family N-acetyltransferase [Candidatus Asgardarchaeia archaeon]